MQNRVKCCHKRRPGHKKSVVVVTVKSWLRHTLSALESIEKSNSCRVSAVILLDGSIQYQSRQIQILSLDSGGTDIILHGWVDEVCLFLPGTIPFPSSFVAKVFEMGITVRFFLPAVKGKHPADTYYVMTAGILFGNMTQRIVKRLIDIVAGLTGCFITGVLFFCLAPVIYCQSPGPVLFVQDRIGKNGKKFRMYKFRSMYPGADDCKSELQKWNIMGDGPMFKMGNDPRIITTGRKKNGEPAGIGHFIRRSSLDEFPQFFNVLKGDMSLVGTRPPTCDEWMRYEENHRIRMSVKPGITGLWQVSGRNLITDFERVVDMDRYYIENWSLLTDFKIIIKTFSVLLEKTGAM